MKVTAHLTDKLWDRFSKVRPEYTQTRTIDIPAEDIEAIPFDSQIRDAVLELAFKYGQNDFQPISDRRSVSVGDVIEFEAWGEFHLVESLGWTKVSESYIK